MNTREKVLKEALNCVNGEREKQYGNPKDNFRRIADLWSTYLTSLFEDENVVIDIDPIDVAKMMILFKIARSNGDKDKLDNYVDILGYGACAAEIFEKGEAHDKVLKKKEELGVQLADECKECDYAEKCIGTGICLKETEKKLLDNKDPYSYAHDKLAHYVEIKASEEHVPLDNLKSIDHKFPRELSDYLHDAVNDCVENGKRVLDCYKEIDELFKKYTNKNKSINEQKDKDKNEGGRIYFNSKITDNNKDVYRNAFNEASEQMILNLKADKKITRCVEVPEGFDIDYIFMSEGGRILVRFNPIKEDKE